MKKKQIPVENTTDQRKLKGQATREKLVIEAIRLFGQFGYKATNTRALADAAQCNLGLITFHFGGKQGLYEAAIERVKRRLIEMLGPTIDKLTTLEQSDLQAKELFKALTEEINTLAVKFIGMEQVAGYALLLLQDINEKNSDGVSGYKEVFMPLIQNIEKIINKATNNANPMRARLSAFLIINATLGFLRDYPIFYPKAHNNTIEQPSISYLMNLLSQHLVGEYSAYFK